MYSVTLYPRNLCLIIVLSDKHSSTNIGRFLFLSILAFQYQIISSNPTELNQSGLYLTKKITNTKSLINHPRYFNVYFREKHRITNVYFGQRICALEENVKSCRNLSYERPLKLPLNSFNNLCKDVHMVDQ